jgi:hypothetical protein
LKAFREEFKELLQVIFVTDWTGFCAEHQHRLPRNHADASDVGRITALSAEAIPSLFMGQTPF